jgi:hypothetical protein
MSITKKALPDPSRPSEVFYYYSIQINKLLRTWFRLYILDPFGTKRKKDFHALINFKGTGSGKACFVIANGPSVQKLDPFKLKSYCEVNRADLFCVNYFVNSTFAATTGVDYWVLSDPNSLDLSREVVQSTFLNAEKLVRRGVFVPKQYEEHLPKKADLLKISFNDSVTSHIFSRSITPVKPRSYASMSAYKALALAVYGGYSPIYICGFDNTYPRNLGCDRDNRIYRINEHFDSKAYPNINPVQYLNYKYRKVSDELIAYSKLFSDLWKFRGHNIINLDIDSLTDAFPKDDSLNVYITDK